MLFFNRAESESSFVSANSSVPGGVGLSNFIGRKKDIPLATNIPQKQKRDKSDGNIVKLALDFEVGRVDFEILQDERELFRFQVAKLCAKLAVKRHRLQGDFSIGCCVCQYMKFRYSTILKEL